MYFMAKSGQLLGCSANLCALGTYVQSGGMLSFSSGPNSNISSDEIPDLQLLLRSKQSGQLTFLSQRYL